MKELTAEVKGRIHSFQSLGAVDGPGLRFVVFLQGCPLRCMYCHNPDTWDPAAGTEYTVDEVVAKILRYRPYFGEDGGVTVSGGEALLQMRFVTALFTRLHGEGINTCLDTSGAAFTDAQIPLLEQLLAVTDLVICDIKFTNEEDYLSHTKGSLHRVLSFLSLTQASCVPLWVRQVIVPGFTDSESDVRAMIALAQRYDNLRKIELLPFRKLCITKYEALGIPFPCAGVEECDEATIASLTPLIPEALR